MTALPTFKQMRHNITHVDRYYYVVAIEVMVYIGVWTFISLSRLYAFKASVFDLGVFVQDFRRVLTDPSYTFYMLGYKPLMVLVSPLEIMPNLQGPLILQTVFLALPALPLYGVGKKLLQARLPSLLLSSSYLLFFSLGGINWFDVHAQAFFIFPFIMGYYMLLVKKYKLGIFFLLLSGTARFPFEIFPLIFGLATILEVFLSGERVKNMLKSREVVFMTFLVIISVVILLISYRLYFHSPFTPTNLVGSVHLRSSTTLLQSLFTNIDNKISTLLIFLAPFIFLPFRKMKWIFLLLPYFYLVFFANYAAYLYPFVIRDQYSSFVIPFLYLGTLEGLAVSVKGQERTEYMNVVVKWKRKISPVLGRALVIFVVIVLLACIFQPYSPLSSYSEPAYQAGWEHDLNPSTFSDLEKIAALIPSNDPYVLFQNNMPEVTLHDPWILNEYEDSVFGFPFNLTFPLGGGKWSNRIDYVVADYNSNTFYQYGSSPKNLTMYKVVSKLYSTGHYGILAEEDGFILLEHNYSGPIIYYQPLSEVISPSQLAVLNASYRQGSVITGTNSEGNRIWYGPYTFLDPGQYQVTFHLSTTNNSVLNSIELWFGDYAEGAQFRTVLLTGENFSAVNKICNITVNITVPNFYNGVEFAGLNAHWSGSLTIYGITVSQILG